MRKDEFYIQDYCGYTAGLGIFFYGERILFGWEKDSGINSYEFRLLLSNNNFPLNREDELFEKINFIHNINLKNLPLIKTRWIDGSFHKHIEWDILLKEIQPEQYEYCKIRLKRKLDNKIVEPVIYTAGEYNKGREFLVFTEDTADNWGGPFKQDGKRGCTVKVMQQDVKQVVIGSLYEEMRSYDFPYEISRELHNKDIFDILDRFESLSMIEQIKVAKKYIERLYVNREERLNSLLPYRLLLSGNDDTSYSKYFLTMEELNKELKYLRMMQPLDYIRDIMDGGYIFTN